MRSFWIQEFFAVAGVCDRRVLVPRLRVALIDPRERLQIAMGIPVQSLHIGMQVRHPRYGVGTIKALTQHTADITFDDDPRTVDPATSELTPAEPTARLTEMEMPLSALIRETAQAMAAAFGLE